MHLGLGGDPQSALVKPRKEAQLEAFAEWHKVELLYHHIIGHLRSASVQTVRTQMSGFQTILVHTDRSAYRWPSGRPRLYSICQNPRTGLDRFSVRPRIIANIANEQTQSPGRNSS